MKRFATVWLTLAAFMMSACFSDPFGMTTRNQNEWSAKMHIADVQAQSSVNIAAIWANAMPIMVFLLVAGFVIGIAIYWGGKTHHDVQTTLALAQSDGVRISIEEVRRKAIEEHARKTGAYIVPGSVEGSYLLKWPDGSERLYLPKENSIVRTGL